MGPTDAQVLADPARADAPWLQRHLDAPLGMPPRPPGPRVEALEIEPLEATTARLLRLRVRYRGRPPDGGHRAERLILKCCDAAGGIDPASEPAYYAHDYAGLADAPLVPCLEACTVPGPAGSAPLGYLLLLEDLSDDYRDHKLVEPSAAHAGALGRALAALHAHRWHRDRELAGPAALDAALERLLEHLRRGLDPVLADLDGALGAARTAALRRCLDGPAETLRRRLADATSTVLIHGDPNPTNVLTPIHGEGCPPDGRRELYLIDRQPFAWSPRVWPAAADLVGASVPWWTPETRRTLEPVLLGSYHRALVDRGVEGYPWSRLIEDYRDCLVHSAWTGVEWGTDPEGLEHMRFLWRAQIERALAAIEHWDGAVPAAVAAVAGRPAR